MIVTGKPIFSHASIKMGNTRFPTWEAYNLFPFFNVIHGRKISRLPGGGLGADMTHLLTLGPTGLRLIHFLPMWAVLTPLDLIATPAQGPCSEQRN